MRHLYERYYCLLPCWQELPFLHRLKADTVHFPWDMLMFTRAAYRHCPVPVRVQVI